MRVRCLHKGMPTLAGTRLSHLKCKAKLIENIIETTSSKQLVCKHNPAELLAAISSLAETYSITVTASFSHVSADADFPFVCASAFGGGESSLRLRKSPWHQSDKYQDSHLNSPWHTMTEVKSNKVGPTHAANNIARIFYIDTLRESIHLFLRKEIQK